MSTKLKLMGVDVASFGDASADAPKARARSITTTTPSRGATRSWSSSDDARTLLGGILVGDASDYGTLRAAGRRGPLPGRPGRR